MILETQRLILRKMTQEDYPALCRMLQDPLCMYAYEHAFSDEEAQQWLDRQLTRYREDGFGLWAMVRKDTCLLYTSPSPRDQSLSRMPSSA